MKHLLIILLCCACNQPLVPETAAPDPGQSADNASIANFHSRIVSNQDGSYGYQIYKDSVLLINQSNIPTRSGTNGFTDSIAAAQVADLAIHKLRSGVFPPTLDAKDIDSILNKFP